MEIEEQLLNVKAGSVAPADSSAAKQRRSPGEKRVTDVPQGLRPITRVDHRIIDAELIDEIAIGASKTEVVAHLGIPSTRFAIGGLPGVTRETLTYHVAEAEKVQIILADGEVADIPRP